MRKNLVGAALVAAAVVVGVVVGLTADWGAAARAGRAMATDPLPMAAAVAAYTAAFALRAAAWGPLLPCAVPFGRRLRALFAMIAVNHALPGPVGEVARARMVSGDGAGQVGFRPALVSVAAARAVDVGCLALLALGAAWAAGDAPAWLRGLAAAGALLPAAAWSVARRRGARLGARQVARAGAWALPSWLLEAGIVLTVARAAGLDVSLAGAVLVTCGAVLSHVVAFLPGGIGTYEAGAASVLVVLGAGPGEALAVAATTHAVKFAYSFALGLPALAWRRPARSRSAVARPAPA